MIYLKAEESDIEECISLKRNVFNRLKEKNLPFWSEEYPSDELIKEDVLSGGQRIIKENNEIIASTVFYSAKDEWGDNEYPFKTPDLYCFSRVMVKTGFENKHVGYFLISNVIEEIKKIGAKGIGIMVYPTNYNALHLYSKFGFKFIETKEYIFGLYSTYELIF